MNGTATVGNRLRHVVSRMAPYATMPLLGAYSGYASFLKEAPVPPSSINDRVDMAFNLGAAAATLVLCAQGGARIHAPREGRFARAIAASVTSRWFILFILFVGLTFCFCAISEAQWALILHRESLPSIILAVALYILRRHGQTRTYEDITLEPSHMA